MKKMLSTLLLVGTLLSTTLMPAFAENFTYKVYNPRTNKSHTAALFTIRFPDDNSNTFIYGFMSQGQPLCVASIYNTNVKNGLVGGQCTDFYAFSRFMEGEKLDLDKYVLGWRELSTDTLHREIESIRRERAAQGRYEYQGN